MPIEFTEDDFGGKSGGSVTFTEEDFSPREKKPSESNSPYLEEAYGLGEVPESVFPNAFDYSPLSHIPRVKLDENPTAADQTSPFPVAKQIGAGVLDFAQGMGEFATSPRGALIASAGLIPGVSKALPLIFAPMMTKGGAEKLGEASVTHDPRTATSGLLETALAGVTARHAGNITSDLATRAINKVLPERIAEPLTRPRGEEVRTAEEQAKADEAVRDILDEQRRTPPIERRAEPGTVLTAEDLAALPEVDRNLSAAPKTAVLDSETPKTPENTQVKASAETVQTPEISVGPGAASATDIQSGTALKNAAGEMERAGLGLENQKPSDVQEMVPAWIESGEVLKTNPNAGKELADSLVKNPKRGLTGDESALLLRHKTQLFNELNQAAEASFKGDAETRAKAAERYDEKREEFEKLLDAIHKRGSEWGREGRWRQAIAQEDFSFATRERLLRAKKRGELTDAERDNLHAETEAWKAEQEKLQKRIADFEASELERQAEAATKAQEDEVTKKAGFIHPKILEIAKKIVDSWDKAADESRAFLKGKLLSPTPEDLYHIARIGRSHLAHAALSFAEWSARMIEDIGAGVEPYLKQAFETANNLMEEEYKKSPAVRNAVKTIKTSEETKQDTIEQIKAKVEAGKTDEIGSLAQKLLKGAIEGGARGWRQANDVVHATLKELIPDWDYRDTMAATSGHGKFTTPKQDEVSVALRDAKTQTNEILKTQEVISGEPVKPTGFMRGKASDAARRLTKLYEAMKRRFGSIAATTEGQLQSALAARKTYYDNAIADLKYEISKRQKIVKNKNASPTDPELEAKKAEYARLKEERDALFPKDNKLTDEQRLKMAKAAAERSIADYERKVKEKEFTARQRPGVSDPELEILKAKRDAARDEFLHLRDLDEAYATEKATKALKDEQAALEKSIAEKKKKIDEGDVSTKGSQQNRPASTSEIEALKQQRDQLNKSLSEMRKKANQKTEADRIAKEVERINKLIEEKQAKIDSGDMSSKGQKQNRPEVQEIEVARQRLEEVNRRLNELRNPKRSADEIKLQAYKTRASNRVVELLKKEQEVNAGTYQKPVKTPIKLDTEAEAIRENIKKIEARIKNAEQKAERANRSRFRKISDFVVNLNRASVLSHLSVIEHLAGAALENVATRPIGTALAQLMRFNETLDSIRKKAVYEGHLGGEKAGLVGTDKVAVGTRGAKGLLLSWRDALDKLTTGSSAMDRIYGKEYPKEFGRIVGQFHAFIKEPVRQGVFARSVELRWKAAEEAGLNPKGDRMIQEIIKTEAYEDANRDIFMGSNMMSKLHGVIDQFLRGQKLDSGIAKAFADVLQIIFPVVNVTTNLAIRKFRLLAGLPETVARLGVAKYQGKLANNAERLTPQEAEQITRAFKYGVFGLGLSAFAWSNPELFGGIYAPEVNAPRDKKSGLEIGDIKTSAGTISHHFAHGQVGGHMNLVADARRVYDREVKNNPHSPWSNLTETGAFTIFAGLRDIPGFSTIARLGSPFKTGGQKLGELLRNAVIPGGVQDAAKMMDKEDSKGKPVHRVTHNFADELKIGIPGLREEVPLSKKK